MQKEKKVKEKESVHQEFEGQDLDTIKADFSSSLDVSLPYRYNPILGVCYHLKWKFEAGKVRESISQSLW